MREFFSFRIASDMAHFRRPYTTTSALTFPFPPRTALCGLVGAILGLPKNECLEKFRDEDAVFGIQILKPLRVGYCSINLIDTKDNPTFRPKTVNPHTTMRYEVIRNPCYRVIFGHEELGPQLAEHLQRGETCYTPCLGLAWMIAWIEGNVERVEATPFAGPASGVQTLISPVRVNDLQGEIQWDADGVYQRIRMPAKMQPNRQVTRYQEYIVDTTGRPIRALIKAYWKCSDGTSFSAM